MTNSVVRMIAITLSTCAAACTVSANAQEPIASNPFEQLMQHARAHAQTVHALTPAISPMDSTVGSYMPITALHRDGVQVIPWTPNNAAAMRALARAGVDGIVTDRPDLLHKILLEEKRTAAAPPTLPPVVIGRAGAGGLRPENTLPAIESVLNQLVDAVQVDTAVTADGAAVLWHDPVFNPTSCRRVDRTSFTVDDAPPLYKLSLPEIQRTYICDRTTLDPDQKNDPALSPVSVAFAAQLHLASPYNPVALEQLFQFVDFYVMYYRTGAGSAHKNALQRVEAAARVRFQFVTRVMPVLHPRILTDPSPPKLTVRFTRDPQDFVAAICTVIHTHRMETRSAVESFDYRTLLLVEEQYPAIQTIYGTETAYALSDTSVPAQLRVVQMLP